MALTERVVAVVRSGCAVAAVIGLIGLAAASSYARYGYPTRSRIAVERVVGESFSFAAFGDIEDDVVGFRDVLDLVDEEIDPDFGVVLGDIAKRSERSRESYIAYFDLVRRIAPAYPLIAIPGNHDRPKSGEPDEYARAFGALNWWFAHGGWVFVGIDNSDGMPSAAGLAVLRDARAAAGGRMPVVLFVHVPVWRAGEGASEPLARRERVALESIETIRDSLGAHLAAVFAAHTDAWSMDRDARGTLHVCCGAEPGLGWPAGATPQIAAVCTVTGDRLDVAPARVPFRRDVVSSARQAGHLYLYSGLRGLTDPVPVWFVTALALAGCWLARRRALIARAHRE